MAHIDIIQYEDSEGELKEAYDHLIETRGRLADVHRIHSLNPKAMLDHMELYMTLMYGKSPLKRLQRELIGVVVSIANECHYCQIHHVEAANHYWKDDQKVEQFLKDFKSVELSDQDRLLCEYAYQHTKNPGADKSGMIQEMKDLGIEDRAILDATMIIGYFNFVNRIVAGLGLELETEGAGGYKFD